MARSLNQTLFIIFATLLQKQKLSSNRVGLYFLFFFVWLSSTKGQNQTCISGTIHSFFDHQAIPFAYLTLLETGQVTRSDSLGNFSICTSKSGSISLLIKQIGFDSLKIKLQPGKNKYQIHLKEKNQCLDAIAVIGQHKHFESDVVEPQAIHAAELDRNRGISLGEILRKIPGISALQTGPTLFKPVIQGMFGQRIAVVNNGTKLEGQSWGFDHSPELDPSGSNEIIVIKGAQAIRFGSEAIGGVVMVEPGEILTQKPTLTSSNGFATNGRGFFQNFVLENSHSKTHKLDWRIQAGGKKSGDFQTARYILGNTAMKEWSASALVRHHFNGWKSEIYGSFILSKIGIFKGSHISSPDGIRLAINRPDSTYNYDFSYTLNRPFQNIRHLTLKAKAERIWSENARTHLQYVHQEDLREEFDLLRISKTGCAICPQLRFTLLSDQLDLNHKISRKQSETQIGVVGFTQGNVVEKNILIPNFRVFQGSVYSIQTWYWDRWLVETGGRLEFRHQQIYRYVIQQFEDPEKQFFNFMWNAGVRFQINNHWHCKMNGQASQRAPFVNEQYSNGVHHGTASFEKGNDHLQPERILNFSYSIHHKSKKWEMLINLFETYSPNFIYLTPLGDSIVTTIRGPFPYYQFQSSEVNMRGADFWIEFEPHSKWSVNAKGALIRSWNYSTGDYLIFQPADRLEFGLKCHSQIHMNGLKLEATVGPVFVSKQYRVPEKTDLAPAPPGFVLWNSRIALRKATGRFPFDFSIEGQNLSNKVYRDYMNRFRYFAYDLGRNFTLRLTIHI